MTVHYQSLKQYGKTMTVDGARMPMNISVALVDVIFPPKIVSKTMCRLFKNKKQCNI